MSKKRNVPLSKSHIYLEVSYINTEANPSIATTQIERMEKPLIKDPINEYVCSIDRFYLHGVRFPIFQVPSNFNLTFGIQTIIGGALTEGNIGGAEFLYNYQDLITRLNTELTTIGTAHGVGGGDIPVFSFDILTDLFTITTTAPFRATYTLQMNSALYKMFSTFIATTADFITYTLTITGNTTTQYASTINMINPVNKIVISTTLPIKEQLLPNPIGSMITSLNAKSILTDYKMTSSQSSSIYDIEFTTTEYRWITLTDTNIRTFVISFEWANYERNYYNIVLDQGTTAGILILFKI